MKHVSGMEIKVVLDASQYGVPRPHLRVTFPRATPWRHTRAVALQIVAEVELATPASERWAISFDEPRDFHIVRYRIVLETDGGDAEVSRAMALLEAVAATLRA